MRPRGLIGLAVTLAIVRVTWHCWRTVRPGRRHYEPTDRGGRAQRCTVATAGGDLSRRLPR